MCALISCIAQLSVLIIREHQYAALSLLFNGN